MSTRHAMTYPYVISRIRAQIGNLLTIENYKSLLGSVRPYQLIHVFMQTSYRDQLTRRAPPPRYEAIRKILEDSFIEDLNLITSVCPSTAVEAIKAYVSILESWSLIAAIRTLFLPSAITAESAVVPCGVIDRVFYQELKSGRKIDEALSLITDSSLQSQVKEAVRKAERRDCPACLFSILLPPVNACLSVIERMSSKEKNGADKVVRTLVDLANILVISDSISRKVEATETRGWLLGPSLLLDDRSLDACLGCTNLECLLRVLSVSAYGRAISHLSDGHGARDCLETSVLKILSDRSRIFLAGYPFRISTIISALNLKWIEARNLNLTIHALERGIPATEAIRFIAIP